MEHLEYFGLPADPFQNDADARFYYESAPQKRARLRLLRGIHQKKALSVLVGGPGLGKTTLAQVVLRALEAKAYAAHYLSVPHEACASGWLMPNVARGFGVPVPGSSVQQQIDQIHAQLVAITTAGRMPVLLIDEAQLFRNREAMEEFRGLLNLSHDGRKLLSLALFGLPELAELLKLDPPLAQRVEVRVEMTAMDWLESQAYVSHRLRLAGADHPVFAPDALEALFRFSGGIPRLLNTLADNSLFEGFLTETRPVNRPVVETAAEALGLHRIPSDSAITFPPVAPPAPDLLGTTEVEFSEPPARPERPKQTMPVARPSPAAAAAPKPAPTPEPEFEDESEEVSAPDWLEPVAPMPAEPPAMELESTQDGVQTEPTIAPTADAPPPEMDFELEEVIAEDTLPPTPVNARSALLAADADLEPELAEPEPEPITADAAPEEADHELGLGADDDGDEGGFSLGGLMKDEEEDALAGLGAPAAEIEDLAPVRRTPPAARPVAKAPPTPAKAMPVRPTPAKAVPARPTPARPTPAPTAASDGEFDLRSLVDDSESSAPALAPPIKDGDEDDGLDALFDEIQIGDK